MSPLFRRETLWEWKERAFCEDADKPHATLHPLACSMGPAIDHKKTFLSTPADTKWSPSGSHAHALTYIRRPSLLIAVCNGAALAELRCDRRAACLAVPPRGRPSHT